MRSGFLHCAAHDETVSRFGRNDISFVGLHLIGLTRIGYVSGFVFDCFRACCVAGGLIGIAGGEGGEIVSAEDVRCGLLQDGEIEREAAGPDVGGEHGRADAVVVAAGEDAVLVGFAQGAVAGVEGFRDGFDGEDADACGKGAVEGVMKIGGGDGDGEGEGGDLREGMDSGVGAARALGKDGLAGDALDGLCEGALDGGEIRLDPGRWGGWAGPANRCTGFRRR